MNRHSLGLSVLFLGLLASIAGASAQKNLDTAAKRGEVAFILVTDQGATGVAQATEVIHQTMKKVRKSTLVELERSKPENANLVAKFRLAGAPVPLVLVAARNGVLAGGLVAAQATSENLAAMVPSPKKAEVLAAIQTGKAVFISVSGKGMSSQSGAMASCAAACGQMNAQGVTIPIAMDDPEETEFLAQLKVDRAATEPVTLVVNAQGQITGTYSGAVEVASLVQAATKKAGGCCPPTAQGGSQSCEPKK